MVGCSSTFRTLEASISRKFLESGLVEQANRTVAVPRSELSSNFKPGVRPEQLVVFSFSGLRLTSRFKHVLSEFCSGSLLRRYSSLEPARQTALGVS